MDLANLLIQLLNSVQYGLLLFMLAAGLTLIFGIMGVVNLAHGSFYMLGAYLAWWLSAQVGNLPLAIVLGALLSVALGLALEWLLFRHFYQRDHLDQVLLTFGLIYVFEELRSLLWGDDVHGVEIPKALDWSLPLTDTLSYPAYRLFMSGLCLLLALGLYLLISRTRLGMKIRAGAFNRDMAESLGINIRLIRAIVFALGVGLAAVAGMIAAPIASVYPNMGSQVLIMCFVVVVIGGIGSVRGALIAALLVGLVAPAGTPPDVVATVNPNRLDCGSGLRFLCAAGVAFLTAVAAVRLLRRTGFFAARAEPDLLGLLDLVALATVCDVMPLTGLNRAFVTQGLKVIGRRERVGLAALLEVAQANERPSAMTLGYALGSRINAGPDRPRRSARPR